MRACQILTAAGEGGVPSALYSALDGEPARLAREAWHSGVLPTLIGDGLFAHAEPAALGGWPFAFEIAHPPRLAFASEWCGRTWR